MHRSVFRAVVLAVIVVLALVSVTGVSANVFDQNSAAGKKQHPRTCSLATLNGRYLTADSGTLLPHAFGVNAPTLSAAAGFRAFNGDGTGNDTITLRVNGEIQFDNIAVNTTYTVDPDCTGTVKVQLPQGRPGPTFDIFVAPDGEMFASIATDTGNYPSSIALRVSE